jgi:hypothetical protein
MSEMKQGLMIAGFHIDLRLCLDAVVDDDIKPGQWQELRRVRSRGTVD